MTRRGRRLLALLLALLVAPAAGCGGEDARDDAGARRRAAHARLMSAGARVFAEQCQTCHPLLGRPNDDVHSDYAPPLDLDQVSLSRAYVRQRVESGGVAMGGFRGTIPEAEFEAVVAYVHEMAGRDVAAPRGVSRAELAAGRRVYDEHCQRCHAIAGRPATDGNPIWVGTDFAQVRPSVLFVEQIVRDGQREAMPSFRDRLTLDEIRAVALYVNATARGGRPAGP
jgi:mono/diheme cytochrome c family protein